MADNRVKLIIELEKSGATASLKNFEGDVIKSGVAVRDLRNELGNFIVHSKKMSNSVKLTQKELRGLEKTVGGFKSATGGATAAAMELGRVVSDAPYGIRGMANNVSQLASQITYMATATDKATGKALGFRGAIKSVGRALMGTTGVLFLIQGVIAAVDYFSNRVDKTEKSVSKLNETFGEEATKLMVLKNVLNDTNVSLETKTEIVKKANEEFEGLNLSLDENGKLSKQLEERIDALSLSFVRNAKARAIASLIQEEMVEQTKIEAQKAGENLKWYETAYFGLISRIKGFSYDFAGAIKRDSENKEESLKDSSEAIKRYVDMLKEKDGELAKLLFGKDKKGKGDKKDKVEALGGLPTAEDVRDYYKDVFKALGDANTFERELEQLNVAKASGHITEEFFNEMKASLEEKYASENLFDGVAPKLELGENAKAAIDKYNKELLKVATDKMAAEDWAGYADAFKQGLSLVSDFVDAQFERDLATEQNKTTAMNDELNQRLLNENLSKDERAKIQQEIWQNDDKLRKKQNEIKKKQFNANKAFQISMAVADTASSALKAYGSQLIIGNPASLIRAKIAAATATAVGLAQIATIASQKFVPESASTPIRTASVGGSGGVGDRSFNFNLVGASQQNQLAQAIQGQFDKPIKAYVVSKDITNQQQLDANTKSTARFGG